MWVKFYDTCCRIYDIVSCVIIPLLTAHTQSRFNKNIGGNYFRNFFLWLDLTIKQAGKLHQFFFFVFKLWCFKTMRKLFNKHLDYSFFGNRFKIRWNWRNRNSFKVVLYIFMGEWLPRSCIHIKIYFLLRVIRMKIWIVFTIKERKHKLARNINCPYRN